MAGEIKMHASRMSSGCCCSAACLCEESLIRSGAAEEETSDDEAPANMDIALLKQEYNSIRDKQKLETRVVYFKKAASNNEEISGKSLVSMVPMRQVRQSLLRQASVQDTRFDFVRDPDSSPWRAHLGMYRRTCAASDAKQHEPTKVKSSTGDSASSASVVNGERSVETTDSSDHLSEDGGESDGNRQQKDCGCEDSRKFSAPAVLSRQLSSGSSRSTHSTTSTYYYPFPQLKSPRKSEAARRLGLYSSF